MLPVAPSGQAVGMPRSLLFIAIGIVLPVIALLVEAMTNF